MEWGVQFLMIDSTIPVRGRKLNVRVIAVNRIGTIPVRGRKRTSDNLNLGKLCTIPVRGRKLVVPPCRNSISEYHPRKGAKTKFGGSCWF